MKELVCDTDGVKFDPTFADAKVMRSPVPIRATGWRPTVNGKPVCLVTDISSVTAPGPYFTETYPSEGAGNAIIKTLKPDQQPSWCKVIGVGVLLMGTQFTAEFTGTRPATQSSQTPNDPMFNVPRVGTGSFITQQKFVTVG